MMQVGQSIGAGCSSYGGSQANDATIGDEAKFQQSMGNNEKASGKTPSPSSKAAAGGASLPLADEVKAPSEEQVQKEMFKAFAEGLDPEVQKRLSKWLPDVLNGDKKDLKEAVKDLGKQEAKDLDDLAKAIDLKHDFKRVKDRDGLFGNIVEEVGHKRNKQGLEGLKQAYGEHALKASTPALAPTVSYDTGSTLDASREAVYEKFVSGLSETKRERLDEWLPDVLFGDKSGKKVAKKLSNKEEDALKALAKEHGIEIRSGGLFSGELADRVRLDKLETLFKRDLALETTGELPSVVDMLLAEKFGKENGDTATHINLKDDDILKEAKAFKKGFGDLDTWLPDVLAGRGEMPEGDKAAKKLLVEFAEEFGFDPKKNDDLGERAEKALNHLEKQDVIGNTLHPGKDGKDSAFLLFTDRFMESTLAYGAKNGALNQAQLLDAANVAEMLLGPDDGTDKPRDLEMVGLQATILHRTDKKLVRPQEVMAASSYINAGETLTEQKTRLTETVLAFHVREKIGTPPMTPLQWAKNYADLDPEMLDDLGNLAFNAPTGEKMQIITQHLGVPGEHKFMIDKKHKVKMEVDQAGNLDHFDRDTKKTKWYKKVLDVAVPVIGAALTLTGVGAGIGAAINIAYGVYKGAEAIKHGDLLGGALGIASAVVPGGNMVSRGIQVASGALKTFRAIESKDWMGALSGGLGTVASGVNMRGASIGSQGLQNTANNFQTVANGVDTAQAVRSGDLLQAGVGFAGMAGDATAGTSSQYAFQGLEQGLSLADGIQEENYAGIGGAAAGLINTGGAYDEYRDEQAKMLPPAPEQGAGGGPGAGGANGETSIRPAGYRDPNGPQAIEVAGGDTLSQIAARHGTTVDALMTANPGIDDPNRIRAGQQLNLPRGVQPVGDGQQQRLQEFADSQGGPSHLPSPARPGQGDPMLQPGATHPNADSTSQGQQGDDAGSIPVIAGVVGTAVAGGGTSAEFVNAITSRLLGPVAGGTLAVGGGAVLLTLIPSPTGGEEQPYYVPGLDNLRLTKHGDEVFGDLEYQDSSGNWHFIDKVQSTYENGNTHFRSDRIGDALRYHGFTAPDLDATQPGLIPPETPDVSKLPGPKIDGPKRPDILATPDQGIRGPDIVSTPEMGEQRPIILDTPIQDGQGPQILESRNNKADGRLGQLGLPTEGDVTFDPQKNQRESDIRKLRSGDFNDTYDNSWKWDPIKQEWDVTLSSKGKDKYGHLSKGRSHLNVSPDGKITH